MTGLAGDDPPDVRLHEAHAGPAEQARWTTRVSSFPARMNSATGSDSFGLWATSIAPGPQMTQSSPSRLS